MGYIKPVSRDFNTRPTLGFDLLVAKPDYSENKIVLAMVRLTSYLLGFWGALISFFCRSGYLQEVNLILVTNSKSTSRCVGVVFFLLRIQWIGSPPNQKWLEYDVKVDVLDCFFLPSVCLTWSQRFRQ